jgi:hypothetical protein
VTSDAALRAAPDELAGLAAAMLDAALTLLNLWRVAQNDLALSPDMFGNLAGVEQLHHDHLAVVEEAGSTIERLAAVHESDVDQVYRTAFAYQQTDRDVAEQLRMMTNGTWGD